MLNCNILGNGKRAVHVVSKPLPLDAIQASGNYWGTTVPAAVENLIFHYTDSAGYIFARVAYLPCADSELELDDSTTTEVPAGGEPILPGGFALSQNYPNPFNPMTALEYSLPARGLVRLEVFNVLGQSVTVLELGERPAGARRVSWNGTDRYGRDCPSGVYVARMSFGEATQTRKMLLIR